MLPSPLRLRARPSGLLTLGATYVYRFRCGLITRTYPYGIVFR
ncbi:hypothetical protein GAMM_40007 [Gammaproteobacteria bacterium]